MAGSPTRMRERARSAGTLPYFTSTPLGGMMCNGVSEPGEETSRNFLTVPCGKVNRVRKVYSLNVSQ